MKAAKSEDLRGRGKQPDHSSPFLPSSFFFFWFCDGYSAIKGVKCIVDNSIKSRQAYYF